MSFHIKLAAYLIGALVLLFVVATPNTRTAPRPMTEKYEPVPITSSATEKELTEETATTTESKDKKEMSETREEPKPITLPSPPIQKKESPLSLTKTAPSVTPVSQLVMGSVQREAGPAAPTPTTTASVKPPPQLSFTEINKKTRAALVNIICTTLRSGSFEPLSGSGVIVDPRGLILTNAHVAEYFLLKDYLVENFVDCIIRTGEPARNRYRATLRYLSPLWMQANYKKIRLSDPTGTGEHDFAFLLINESINQETLPLPKEFPALEMDFTDENLREKNQVIAAGYPAGLLSGINIQKDLYPSSSVVTIGGVFTFREKTADIFSIGGSLLAQQGSSGGAVISRASSLIGLIVTSSRAPTTGERNIHAITMSHIARSFTQDTGRDITEVFAGDLAAAAESFNQHVAPALTKLLESALQKK